MKKVYTALTLILVVSLMLVACGDSTATTSTGSTTSAAATVSTTTSSAAMTPTAGAMTTAAGTTAAMTTAGSPAAMTTAAMTPASGATSSTGLTQGDTGLPAYTGATTIKVGANFEQTIATPFVSQILGNTANVKYTVFDTADNSDKVLAFYDTAMTKAGLTKATMNGAMPSMAGLTNLVKVAAYQKSGATASGAGVVVLGPMDFTTLTALSALDSSLTSGVKAGDSVIILVSNLSSVNS